MLGVRSKLRLANGAKALGLVFAGSALIFSLGWSSKAAAQTAPPATPPATADKPAAAPAEGSADCPPGSWFCQDEKGSKEAAQPSAAPAAAGQAPAGAKDTAPVVVYQNSPPPVVVVKEKPPPPAPYPYKKRPDFTMRRNEWGLNLRLEGVMLGGRRNRNSGMGGLGLGLRYKPIPYLGMQADLDFVGGRDYNGDARGETAFSMNALVFVNPKSRAQVYFLGGFGWSGARVEKDAYAGNSYISQSLTYSYFGGQAGVGIEFRISKHFALSVDGVAFLRGRTDSDRQRQPEFVSPDGQSSNTSAGGLLRGGMTIYF